MENQLENLKLNAKNIKSSLVFSNKELSKLRSDKKVLFKKIALQDKRLAEEKRIETKMKSGFKGITDTVTKPVKGIFDSIMEFLGLILTKFLIDELPTIIAKIEEFLNSDFVKGVKKVFKVIGDAFVELGKLFGILPPEKQEKATGELSELEKSSDDDNLDYNEADKEEKNFLSWLTGYEKDVDLIPDEESEESGVSQEQQAELSQKADEARQSGQMASFREDNAANQELQRTPAPNNIQPSTTPKANIEQNVNKDNPLREGNNSFEESVSNINEATKEDEGILKQLESLQRNLSNLMSSAASTAGSLMPGRGSGMGNVTVHDQIDLSSFEGNVISVGKAILNQGFTISENKYFTKNHWGGPGPNPGGFNPRGDSPVGRHASSDHGTNALDITDWRGSFQSGIPRLKNLFLSLYDKKEQYGIKSLIFDPAGHWFQGMRNYSRAPYGGHGEHLHVGFTVSADSIMKQAQTNEKLTSLQTTGAMPNDSEPEETIVVVNQNKVKTVPVVVPITKTVYEEAASNQQLTSAIWGG